MRIPAFNYPDQLDFTYTLNSIFSLWILFRIPLFMQTLFNQTIYASHRSQRIGLFLKNIITSEKLFFLF